MWSIRVKDIGLTTFFFSRSENRYMNKDTLTRILTKVLSIHLGGGFDSNVDIHTNKRLVFRSKGIKPPY